MCIRDRATSGIQAGHMKLHARNMAVSAGAIGDEIEKVATIVNSQSGPVTQQLVKQTLEELRRWGSLIFSELESSLHATFSIGLVT